MSYSKRDLDDLKPCIDQTVQKFLGFSEPTLVTTAINCFSHGYDKKKTTDKLSSLLDDSKASKLAEQLFKAVESLKIKNKTVKRKKLDDDAAIFKRSRFHEEMEGTTPIPAPGLPSPGQLSTIQIKEMMANAQKMIEERKKALSQMKFEEAVSRVNATVDFDPDLNDEDSMPVPDNVIFPSNTNNNNNNNANQSVDNRARIAELTAQIQAKLGSRPNLLLNSFAQIKLDIDKDKPTPLILNAEGRTVDVTGREIQLTHRMPTLKANIRAQRREQFKLNQEKVTEDITEQQYFDPRVSVKIHQRTKKQFRFFEKGKFEQLAQRLRTKSQLERLQQEIAQAARKTGISSVTRLALIAPKKEIKEGDIPEIEWWDSFIIKGDSYESALDGSKGLEEKLEGVTNLVEHPAQLKAPTDPLKPILLPVFLTKKERKKLRRQNRREAWKEKQEKIRLGLDPPPEPKVRMSNLMRVLGTQQIQDPTKIEAHVREQMIKRQRAHEEANAARKLTTEQRRRKKIKKLKEDTSLGVHVAVYRMLALTSPSKKFKIEMNAKQLFMSGCVILYRNVNVVVTEGGAKQQRKFRQLMTRRIKWADEQVSKDGSKADKSEKTGNKCVLVWEGTTKGRSFGEMKFKSCPTENVARDHFKKHGVEHYWDLAYSSSILEVSEDN